MPVIGNSAQMEKPWNIVESLPKKDSPTIEVPRPPPVDSTSTMPPTLLVKRSNTLMLTYWLTIASVTKISAKPPAMEESKATFLLDCSNIKAQIVISESENNAVREKVRNMPMIAGMTMQARRSFDFKKGFVLRKKGISRNVNTSVLNCA